MFQFPWVRQPNLCIQLGYTRMRVGFPIRKSPDQRICASTRGLSQLITSFIASRCQGIHHEPLVAFLTKLVCV
jgi:hypothetical protein